MFNLQGFTSFTIALSRRERDSNPRYSNPVRQFSKPVYGKNFCKNIFTLYSVQ
nr:MAG TPA: hypothetical protein [Caudoviricetes sp.]